MNFKDLKDFIQNQMRMSHIYQPVMLIEILKKGGYASAEQKRQYDEQQAKIQKEKERKKNMKLIELGLRMATGQSATDASMATAGMIPLPRAPQQPTLQFNEQYRVTLPDGSLYQCTYNPNFKSAQCN